MKHEKNETPVNGLTVEAYQAKVDRWVKTHGVRYFSEMTNLAILVEEVGEVARLMARTYGEQSFKAEEPESEMADELADVMFVVACLANQTGIDLTEALEKNLLKKTRRDHRRHWNNAKLTKSDTP